MSVTRPTALTAVALLAAAGATAAPAASAAPATPSYTVRQVGDLGGDRSFATALSPNGTVAGTGRTTTGLRPQLPWIQSRVAERPRVLPVPAGSTFGRVLGLNARGDAVGEVFTAAPESSHAALWGKKGGLTVLTGLGPTGSAVANAVNARGDVVGASATADTRVAAVVWRKAGAPQPLAFLDDRAGAVARANDVEDSGRVVGSSTAVVTHDDHAHAVGHAVIWDHGAPRDLGALTETGWSAAKAVSNRMVVGEGSAVGGVTRALDFSSGRAVALPQLGTWKHSTANDVNASGTVVGSSTAYAGAPTFGGAATMWKDGRAIDLNTVAQDLPAGWTLVSANAIDPAGRIAGYATDGRGGVVAVLLSPSGR